MFSTITASAYAETNVKQIVVIGNQRIEADTVKAFMVLPNRAGISQNDINAALKRLYNTGLFADVTITQEDEKLLVKVEENPIVNEIAFEGNKRIDDTELAKETSLQSRSVFTRAKAQSDVQRLLNVYQKNGRFSAEITPKIIELDHNRVNVVFEIDEGKKATVKKILFVGNEAFTDTDLSKVIHTKESRWYRFFSDADIYDPDRVAFDKETLRKHYINRGYADFKVESAIAEITTDKESFFLTFTLNEGNKYNFGDITVKSVLKDVDPAKLKEKATTLKGETFNAEQIDQSIEAMTDLLRDSGYAFVDIDAVHDQQRANRIINLTYKVQEGPKVYVERINIDGNVRTIDKVIRREFRLSEGDPYNAAQIRRSQQRIRNLGFFEKVDVDTTPGSAPDKANIDVKLSERSTGELNFTAGFSTTEGALVGTSIRERNLLGKGQELKFNVQKATRGFQADVGFTEPYFMDKDLSVGADVFRITRELDSESSYDSEVTGITLRSSYSLTEHTRHTLRYSIRKDEITDVDDDASRFIREQEGENTVSLVGHTLMLDKRDSRFDPREGYAVRFNQDFAGLGGDSKFIRNELRTSYYHPIYKKEVIFNVIGNAGYIFGLNDEDVRINQRFFVGGNEIRGFRNAGIGPRDTDTNDALGGNIYYSGSAELTFPLGLPEELGFRGSVFMDAGTLYDVDNNGSEVADEGSIRAAAGVGLSWRSPLGPIRINYGNPFKKESFDRTQQIRFNFGTRF